MLTATYSLLAIRFEQKNACSILVRLRHNLHSNQREKECVGQSMLVSIVSQLQHFDQYLQARKIERHVIPVLCCATSAADLLLAELEMFSLLGRRSLSTLQQYLHLRTTSDHHPFFSAAECYCDKMCQRLVKEDKLLLPLIGEILTSEDWFALGARFLAEDGERYASRCVVPSPERLAAVMSGEKVAVTD